MVVLMRGHGDSVVGPSLPNAVFRAYYTEINARQQLQAIAIGAQHGVVAGDGLFPGHEVDRFVTQDPASRRYYLGHFASQAT